MIIDLKSFDDLGKCSLATLHPEFNTQTDHIYIAKRRDTLFDADGYSEIKIEKVSDLFPYLWCVPSVSTRGNNEMRWFFSGTPTTWWESEYGRIIDRYENVIEKCSTGKPSKRKSDTINDAVRTIEWANKRMSELGSRMSENEKKILNDNM